MSKSQEIKEDGVILLGQAQAAKNFKNSSSAEERGAESSMAVKFGR